MIPSFPKIFTYGDKFVSQLFEGPVEVTEKIDGSQFSFGRIEGNVCMRSKGAEIFFRDGNAGDKMFKPAKDFVQLIEHNLPEGLVFHGEYLQRPKHNTLTYERVPKRNFALFGITYLPSADPMHLKGLELGGPTADREFWADFFGCDTVPVLFEGEAPAEGRYEWAKEFLNRISFLGIAAVEGVVFKNYDRPAFIGGVSFPFTSAKLVGEDFKEKHKVEWKAGNPDNLERIASAFNAKPRWAKSIQKLRETGQLTESPKDIGPLLKEINIDLEAEETENIKDLLWNTFRKDILRIATRGFPEWYKQQLAEKLMTPGGG